MRGTYAITVDSRVFDKLSLQVSGRVSIENAVMVRDDLVEIIGGEPLKNVIIDLAGVEYFDTAGAAVLKEVEKLCMEKDNSVDVQNIPPHARELLSVALGRDHASGGILEPRAEPNLIIQVGEETLHLGHTARDIFTFIGATAVALYQDLRHPKSLKWDSLWKLIERSGSDAVPIVIILSFLMGAILGFQAAVQLKKFGANIFVADLVSVSMCWEMGPLMVAIIASGRLGAAFAAHIGTMQVTQEVDALRVMGVDPIRYLVSPRVLAAALALPCLTIMADFVGILGGCLVANFALDITPAGYFNQIAKVLDVSDVMRGLFKSLVFGVQIAMVGCLRGFQVRGGAESVGRATTSAVVTCIFVMVLTDAVFAAFFYYLPAALPFAGK